MGITRGDSNPACDEKRRESWLHGLILLKTKRAGQSTSPRQNLELANEHLWFRPRYWVIVLTESPTLKPLPETTDPTAD